MVSYQYLYTFIALNFILLFAVFLSGILSKKAARLRDTLTAVIWLIFSGYYKLRLSHHLPADIHSRHLFLDWFLVIVYGFGCFISIIMTAAFVWGSIKDLFDKN